MGSMMDTTRGRVRTLSSILGRSPDMRACPTTLQSIEITVLPTSHNSDTISYFVTRTGLLDLLGDRMMDTFSGFVELARL